MQENTLNLDQQIEQARNTVIAQYESNYGANVTYAKLLNQKWAHFDWFELKHTDTSDEGKAVKAEADKFRKGVKPWHKNPSVAWGQVRTHGRNAKYPTPEVIEGECTGEGEGSGEGEGEPTDGDGEPMDGDGEATESGDKDMMSSTGKKQLDKQIQKQKDCVKYGGT
jgi:hypothetical protein